MQPLLNIAISAARQAGDIIVRHIEQLDRIKITAKSNEESFCEVDIKAEQAIINSIHKAYPDHGIIAEESGIQNGDAESVWIIDPLDGTNNFLHSFPFYAVSIALRVKNRIEHAVVYDPLDGSSLIDANFSIGSIFGVYPGTHLLGRKVSDMIAAAYVVYGPRTILVLSFNGATHEFILDECNFVLVRENIKINFEGKYFAPGNLRAYSESVDYKKLIDYWISNKYTLRYSGGMVPDIHHILVKLGGIFAYPGTPENKDGKLRLLYECGPMALIVTNAGGLAVDGYRKILDLVVESLHQKSPIFIGSSREVEKCIK